MPKLLTPGQRSRYISISMAEVIRMPKMSDTMTDGVIAAWLKKVGDKIKSGDVLAEVETDKATMELESYSDGTLLHIGIEAGASVPVDGLIAIIGKEGEDFKALLNGNGSAAPQAEAQMPEEEQPEQAKNQTGNPPTPAAPTAPIPNAPASPAANVKATVIRMPKMSDTMTEGTIVAWSKKVGDKVKSGDLLAEVETDKATMELESYEDGTLLYIGVEAGQSVVVDGVLAIVGDQGADYQQLLTGSKPPTAATPPNVEAATAPQQSQTTASATPSATPAPEPQAQGGDDGRIKASPLARKLAEDKGVPINQIKGTGENGRVVRRDIEGFTPQASQPKPAAAPSNQPAPAAQPAAKPAYNSGTFTPGQESFEEVPVSNMRKVIARRLAESKFTAPHFYLTMEIDMTKAVEARKSLNEFTGGKISFNDLVLKAAAAALRQHPKVNASWLGEKIRYNHHIHIGVAVAVEEGLLVPVVRFADQKSLTQISLEVKDLGAKAKNKQLQPKDWEGNTFTISNLGMFGIEEFTAIINPPDACILAVGGIKEAPVVRNGEIKIASLMKVTLSCDHRVVDGAIGSAFLQTLKGLLEDPVRILA